MKADVLLKRARSKWYTQRVIGSLLYLDSKLHKYYQRAYYCNSLLTQQREEIDGVYKDVITGTYCDTRVCNVCNRIRTAKMMNGYMAQLGSFNDLEFVTLTLPNVSVHDLPSTLDFMTKTISNIVKVFRVRRKDPISGIRKLEITYNSKLDNYHPHFHLIVDHNADEIVYEWLKRIPSAKRKAQKWTKADKGSLNELFKYTTKIVHRKNTDFEVYTEVLDNIMLSLRNRRTFQNFGSVRRVSETVDSSDGLVQLENTEDYSCILWQWDSEDWYHFETGEPLTNYNPPDISFKIH